MLYSVTNPKVESVYIATDEDNKPVFGFTITYKTRSNRRPGDAMSVGSIPHLQIADELEWREVYRLVPHIIDGQFSVMGIENQSLNMYSVELITRDRVSTEGHYYSNRETSVGFGLLSHRVLGNEVEIGATTEGRIYGEIAEQLLAKFASVGSDYFRALDSGYYRRHQETLLPGPMQHMTIGTRNVATFTHQGTTLQFKLSDSLLDEYKLKVNVDTGYLRYLDDKDLPVEPNMFTWL